MKDKPKDDVSPPLPPSLANPDWSGAVVPHTPTAEPPPGAMGQPPYTVDCPTCHAKPYVKCREKGVIVQPHVKRKVAAGTLLPTNLTYVTCPSCGAKGASDFLIHYTTIRGVLGQTSEGTVVLGPIKATKDYSKFLVCGGCGKTWDEPKIATVADTEDQQAAYWLPGQVLEDL